MIQCGALNGLSEAMNAFQSARVRGAKIFVFLGQLFLSVAFRTFKQFMHFTRTPGLYLSPAAIDTSLHTQPLGLPGLGFIPSFSAWQ
jgi:hypothetical protein